MRVSASAGTRSPASARSAPIPAEEAGSPAGAGEIDADAVRAGAAGAEAVGVGRGGVAARRRAAAGFGGAALGIARTVRVAACSAVAPSTRCSATSSEAAADAVGGMVAERGSAGTVVVVDAERGTGPSRWEESHF